MSDEELCKALRSALWGQGHHINIKAADRIEQLERQLDTKQAKLTKAVEALEWACNTLKEVNPWNYDHGDVCYLNDASVEVTLGIRDVLAELEKQ